MSRKHRRHELHVDISTVTLKIAITALIGKHMRENPQINCEIANDTETNKLNLISQSHQSP